MWISASDYLGVRIVLRAALLMLFVSGAFLLLAWMPGRMTGGGSIFTDEGMRVTHGFGLYCQIQGPDGNLITPETNNLEINWEEHRFHLEELIHGDCLKVEGLNAAPPDAPFTHFYGEGFGRLNGESGARVTFLFVDDGEPGTKDFADITIWDSAGTVVLATGPQFLMFGNHQAHKANAKAEGMKAGDDPDDQKVDKPKKDGNSNPNDSKDKEKKPKPNKKDGK